jgi:hypothetical protein
LAICSQGWSASGRRGAVADERAKALSVSHAAVASASFPAFARSTAGFTFAGGLSVSTSQFVSSSVRLLGITNEEQLRDRAATMTGDDVYLGDCEGVEQGRKHFNLNCGRERLVLRNFGVSEAHEVGCDTTTLQTQTVNRAAPLKAVEWCTMQKECSIAGPEVDIGDLSKRKLTETPGRSERRRVQWLRSPNSRPYPDSACRTSSRCSSRLLA